MNDVLEGTTALAIAKEDRIAAARILCKFADASKDKFSVKAGYMDGKLMEKASVRRSRSFPAWKACSPCSPAPSPTPSAVWPWPCRLM